MNGMEIATTWDYRLILLSVVIAIIGSFVALDFAGRMKTAENRIRRMWFAGGALMMGLAIWTMHFIGMMAQIMPMRMTYDGALMALSIGLAILGAGIAFVIMNRQALGTIHLVSGSLAMGLAIAAMHYTGMASMQMNAIINYDPFLFTASIVIAITASAAALWIAFQMRIETPSLWFWQKVGSAVLMGIAIAGMHYTGMAAAKYTHVGNVVSGLAGDPNVGIFELSDLVIAASVLFGVALILLTSQTAREKQKALQNVKNSLKREQLASGMIDRIRSTTDLNTILQEAVEQLGQFTRADRCVIWPYDSESQAFGTPYEYRSDTSLPSITSTAFPDQAVFPTLNSHQTIQLTDVLHASELTETDRAIIKERKIISLLHVPIRYQNALLGILRIHATRSKRKWDTETVSMVENIAAQVAIAVHNANVLEDLKASEARKSAILASSLDAVITIDKNALIVEWNPGAERIFGYTAEEIIGQSLTDSLIPERYREAHTMGMRRFLETGEGPVLGKLIELPAIRKDGAEFPSELWIVPIQSQDTLLFTSTLRDITDRKQAEAEIHQLTDDLEQRVIERTQQLQEANRELSQSETRFRTLVNNVKDYAIFRLDPDGFITTGNIGVERIQGYKASEIIGKHFSIFYPPEALAKKHPAHELKVAAEQGRFEEEGWRLRKDGSQFWASVIITAIRDEQDELVGFSKVTQDLTQRKEMEAELIQRAHQLEIVNKELEAFSYSVSHDLRAPLRSIDGFSQAVMEMAGDKLNERELNYLNRVRTGSQHMARLIDDLLNLSRLTRGSINIEENVDLSEMVQDIATEFQSQSPERHVAFHIEPGLKVQGDKRLLNIALQNLIGNSWKYTSKHPSACIEFGHVDNGHIAYYIKDDGAGFDMTYSGKLFGAFQRLHTNTEFDGTGIGLATLARIIHRHGGEVWAEGAVEEGATFYFTLGQSHVEREQSHE